MSKQNIVCYTSNSFNTIGGKFAPKEKIVYELPSIDECISLLPRSVGNHILSFTSAWFDFWIELIREKYGNSFMIDMIQSHLYRNRITFTPSRSNKSVLCDIAIRYIKTQYISAKPTQSRIIVNKETIMTAFNQAIQKRNENIEHKRLLRFINEENKKAYKDVCIEKIKLIEVGDVMENTRSTSFYKHIVIHKTEQSITTILCEINYDDELNSYLMRIENVDKDMIITTRFNKVEKFNVLPRLQIYYISTRNPLLTKLTIDDKLKPKQLKEHIIFQLNQS
jgi:hypothetical protein